MLKKLSFRNAKRQWNEYTLFFITLIFSVAAMYAFNALLFSEIVRALPDMEMLPYLIIMASLLIVLIMGWLVSYMIHYMLRKRSREFSIYMLSGISNKKIAALIWMENSLIGLLAFVPGLAFGMLLSQILEAVLLSLFGMSYMLHFGFSPPAAALTFFYFLIVFWRAVRKNGKRVRRVQLRELMYYDRQNEKPPVPGKPSALLAFWVSILAGCAGMLLMVLQPLGKGYDVLLGIILLLAFLGGFFLSVPTFLTARWGNRSEWKYTKYRLVPFRMFTAKLYSMSTVMGTLSILFMLSLLCSGMGTAIGLMMRQDIQAGAFDIMILHPGGMGDFTRSAAFIEQAFSARGYAYGIYTNKATTFRTLYNQAVASSGRTVPRARAEFQYDTCMGQSDYIRLRELLGYAPLPLDPARCYVHCVPPLADSVKTYIERREGLTCAGYVFAGRDGVFSEPFSQLNGYGNGEGYILIVPDRAVQKMEMVYSVYAAVTENPVSPDGLESILSACDGLMPLDRSSAKNAPGGAPTHFTHEGRDYLSGKWADKGEYRYLYAMLICLFYLALILEVMGAAILTTQVLGDGQSRQRQNGILRQLGMRERLIARMNSRQLSRIFLLPLFPALVLSACFVLFGTKRILRGFFPLPVVPDAALAAQSLSIAGTLFAVLYGVYYMAARFSYVPRGR